jgi:hypothetical protein
MYNVETIEQDLSSGVVAFCSNMVLPCNGFFVFVSKKIHVP